MCGERHKKVPATRDLPQHVTHLQGEVGGKVLDLKDHQQQESGLQESHLG
jgi:hypothetical protein